MSTVLKQSIVSSVISYTGVVIGYVNLIILYPKFLEPEQIGLLRTIQDAAILFAPFAQVGLGPAIIRFYPQFAKNENNTYGFLSFVILAALAGFGIFLVAFFSFQPLIAGYFAENAGALLQHTNLILWLTFFLLAMAVFEFYGRSLLRITFPNFLREVGIRLVQAVLVSLYVLHVLTFNQFLAWSVATYCLSLIALIGYLIFLGKLKLQFNFAFLTGKKVREIFNFSFLAFVGNSAMMIIAKVDSLMVSAMIGFASNAIYTTAVYIATLVEIPKRSLSQLAMPLLSTSFEKNDHSEIYRIYHKTSINQMIVGLLLLIGVAANLHNIFQLMPRGDIYREGAYVVLIVGLGKWFDMAFGPSSEIIILSRYYWINILLISFLAILVIATNYLLIPRYGIMGAAIGSAIAMLVFNGVKFILIRLILKVQPFNRKSLYVLLIGGVTFALNEVLPTVHQPVIDALYRSFLITLTFGSLIILTRVSDESIRVVNGILGFLGSNRRLK